MEDKSIQLKIVIDDRTLVTMSAELVTGDLCIQSDSVSESELHLIHAFLLDSADAIEAELTNGHSENKH